MASDIKNNKPKTQDYIDLKKIIFLVLDHWYIFLATILISFAGAYLYLKHTMPVYKVNSTLLIEDENKPTAIGTEELLKGFGLNPGMKNLDNQIQILKSYTLTKQTLKELPFDLDYYSKGRINIASFYPNSPIVVVPDSGSTLPPDMEFAFEFIDDNQFKLSVVDEEISTKASFGQPILFKGICSFTVLPNPEFWPPEAENHTIYFKYSPIDNLVADYLRRLNVEVLSEEGTIVNLSLEGTNRQKDIDFLNKLIEVFQFRTLDKKNQEAVRIIEFIDEQLIGISDSLMIAEKRLQEFRSKNRVMDVSAQGQQIIDQAVKLEDEKARLELESEYFTYLNNYLSSANTQKTPIAPATMGIVDPALAQLVENLAKLQTEYYSGNVGSKNPIKNHLLLKIKNVRQSLQETLKNISHVNELARKDNKEQIRNLNAQATGLPATERKLLGIERKFKLNDVLYTYLLQRRAEAQIQMASNIADNELIDAARPDPFPLAPSRSMVLFLAMFAALAVPFGILLLFEFFKTTINSEDELKNISNLSIAGYIPHHSNEKKTAVLDDPHSIVSEAFRSIRTRIQFASGNSSSTVILISSSMPGEGKSFTALNLASSYSLLGKKTVLIGFDLRRPKLYNDFDLNNEKGISTWLIGQDELNDIIQPTNYDNLDLISAGPVPPNPAELAAPEKLKQLVQQLRNQYEYIIFDSAPMGTVSDAYAVVKQADLTILMVRNRVTIKKHLQKTLSETEDHKVNSIMLVVNDINSKSFSNRYAYSYGYGYGYKYRYEKQENQISKRKNL